MANLHQYPLTRSPLYRLRSKTKLAQLLNTSTRDLVRLVDGPTYNIYPRKEKGKKPRLIEEPLGLMKDVHNRLQNLLRRIETPPYLFSGKKGVSHINNAEAHLRGEYFLSLDIERFYPSSRVEYVFRFFSYEMLMPEDLAWLVAKLVTCQGHVPTGSSLSQSIAYRSYSRFFDSLNELAQTKGMTFSVYVDDITFSSPVPIPKSFRKRVEQKLRNVELANKKAKDRLGTPKDFKVVTGCAISPEKGLAVPNRLRKKIIDAMSQSSRIEDLSDKAAISLIGRLEAARRIEPTFHDSLYRKLSERRTAILKKKNQLHRTNKKHRNVGSTQASASRP